MHTALTVYLIPRCVADGQEQSTVLERALLAAKV